MQFSRALALSGLSRTQQCIAHAACKGLFISKKSNLCVRLTIFPYRYLSAFKNVKNLCSGFSYCLTVLGNAYVWHGLGSLDSERSAAVQYAGKLGGEITELFQGNNDSDETFWMVLGDEDYATADYWKWRRSSSRTDPRIWRIDASSASVEPVRSFIQGPSVKSSVFVADCVWEIYVIVGFKARANRADIRFGIEVATVRACLTRNLQYR